MDGITAFLEHNSARLQTSAALVCFLPAVIMCIRQKTLRPAVTSLYYYCVIALLLLPDTDICYDTVALYLERRRVCYTYAPSKAFLIPTILYVVYMLFVVRYKCENDGRIGFFFNNIFVNRKLQFKHLRVYLALEILQLVCLLFVCNGLFSFIRRIINNGVTRLYILKLIKEHKLDVDFYLKFARQMTQASSRNFIAVLSQPKFYSYIIGTFVISFPGISFFMLDFLDIFMLTPTAAVSAAAKSLYQKGCKKVLYNDGENYWFLRPDNPKAKTLKRVDVEELKALSISSTFSLQRGFGRIFKGVD